MAEGALKWDDDDDDDDDCDSGDEDDDNMGVDPDTRLEFECALAYFFLV